MTDIIREHAEQLFATELAKIQAEDHHPKPPNWALSPWGVLRYLEGDDGISVKYFGSTRLLEMAIATLATDRALLLTGLPGTGKTWLAEHLAAAISGDSSLLVQGTAGTSEESVRYGWNYASLLAKGPTPEAIVPSPIMLAMQTGKIARVEELTRMPVDIQDSLITILSEKTLPIPELHTNIAAVKGFNVIATANSRDRGVNELSSALKRRFNTIELPLPDDLYLEMEIIDTRLETIRSELALPAEQPPLEEIRRVVTIFRELRNGVTEDGKHPLKSPSSTLSTAEIISVFSNGLSLAGYFGNGHIQAKDIAASLVGTIVKDPQQDSIAWQEYLKTVMAKRADWDDLLRACYAHHFYKL